MEKKRKNNPSLSKTDSLCLKGIAIIILIFNHSFRASLGSMLEKYDIIYSPFSENFITNICEYFKICVPIFAFITGYGLYLSAKDKCKDLKSCEKWVTSRYIKTFSGFWFIYILSFVITQIYDKYPQSIYCKDGMIRGFAYAVIDFLGLASLLTTPTMLGTWWYMSAALVFIILIPIALKWSEKLGYITLIVSLIALPRLLDTGYPGGMTAYPFILAVIMGMIFAQYDLFAKINSIKITKNKVVSELIQFAIYIVLIISSIYVWLRLPREKAWEYHYAFSPLIIICFCRKYITRIPVIKDILSFLGKHSMNIFLIHTFLRYTFFDEFIYSFKHFWLIALVLLAVSLAVSIVIEFIKKLIKFDKFILFISNKTCYIIDKI